MSSCAPIIDLCRHVLPNGRRCQQPAVSHRTCCRHHLDAQARLHNMARARRRALILRLRVPETFRDLDWNKAEINREAGGRGYTNPAELAKSERRIANKDDRRAPSSRHL